MMKPQEIEKKLTDAFPGSKVQVKDLTGTSDHFQVVVVSEIFQGKSLLEQHRIVYAPLEKDLGADIHALSIKTMTPTQAQERTDT